MKTRLGLLLLLLMVFIVMLSSVAQCVEEVTTPAEQFLSGDPKKIDDAFYTVLDERKETIKVLISVLEKKDVDKLYMGPFHKAVMLLGKLRAIEAGGILSKNLMYLPLTFRGGYVISGGSVTEGFYVCARALVDIGEPSIDAMLYKICMSRDVEERNVAAWVIMRIEGSDQALHRLDGLIKDDSYTKEYKAKFQEARDYIANWKPDFRHPLQVKKDKEEAAKQGQEKSQQAPATTDNKNDAPAPK